MNITARKKKIFNKYIKKESLTKDDYGFLEEIDWHPADELPFKKEFIKELKKADCEKMIKTKISDLFKN
jgi:hypothetical protein